MGVGGGLSSFLRPQWHPDELRAKTGGLRVRMEIKKKEEKNEALNPDLQDIQIWRDFLFGEVSLVELLIGDRSCRMGGLWWLLPGEREKSSPKKPRSFSSVSASFPPTIPFPPTLPPV